MLPPPEPTMTPMPRSSSRDMEATSSPASATASATLAAASGTARETCGRSLISTYFFSSNSSGTSPAEDLIGIVPRAARYDNWLRIPWIVGVVQLRMPRRFWNCSRLWVFLVCSVIALCGTVIAQSGGGYLIATVAGSGTQGFSGDGGSATAAQLLIPAGVAVDASGIVFVADTGNSRIRKVSASGIITTVAGTDSRGFSGAGGPATVARLDSPYGVAVDPSGNLFIADTNNQSIRKGSASGSITTAAGNGTAGDSGAAGL